jgi:predicted DNA-binding antitoxin AbrB/MazE fold protein
MIKVKLKDGEIGHVKEEDFDAFRKEYLGEEEEDLSKVVAAIKSEAPIKKIIVKAVKRNSLGLIQGCELEVMR